LTTDSNILRDGSYLPPRRTRPWVRLFRHRLLAGLSQHRVRGRYLFLFDVIGIVLGAYGALAFRNRTIQLGNPSGALIAVIAFVVLVRMAVNVRLRLYARDWRFASIPDLAVISVGMLLGTVVAAVSVMVVSAATHSNVFQAVPLAFWPVELLLATFVIGGSRFGIRALHDFGQQRMLGDVTGRPTLLYGAGHIGALIARSAQRTPSAGVMPMAFLDDDPALVGTSVAGVEVRGGFQALAELAAETGATTLLITMSNARGSAVRRIVEAATALQLEVRIVPSVVELLDGTIDAYRVRKVRVEDLLRRPLAERHSDGAEEMIKGKIVLITGAGGSIGSELARQVFAMAPAHLILVDRAESALFDIHRQLIESNNTSSTVITPSLTNVVSRAAMARLIQAQRPDIVFHAAAYKHVPMMESYPSEAVHVNIAGTLSVLDACAESDVKRFVLVSTDKAVKPTSVMGASKRVAELLVADTALRTGRPYVSVRFGNVLGSNGSVVPIFQEQLENGKPLTITHPDMTRFFMTIPEASWLILDAAAQGRCGDLFVLDMGQPVRILDLAKDVTRLSGRDPESQPLRFTGLRPGEKLHEELFYDAERVEETSVPKVLRAAVDPPPANIREVVGQLMETATGSHDDDLRVLLFTAAGRATDGIGAGSAHETVRIARDMSRVPVTEPVTLGTVA
jgi:FlaA1/EpsC-like NDP-sugar epimerase